MKCPRSGGECVRPASVIPPPRRQYQAHTLFQMDPDSLSSRVQGVTPSLTLAVTNQAKALQAQGDEVYGLAGGEPEMDTPDHIKAAAAKALQDGKTKYTPAAGIPELREAIAGKLLDDNGLKYCLLYTSPSPRDA